MRGIAGTKFVQCEAFLMQLEPELSPSLRRATVSKLVDRRSDRPPNINYSADEKAVPMTMAEMSGRGDGTRVGATYSSCYSVAYWSRPYTCYAAENRCSRGVTHSLPPTLC